MGNLALRAAQEVTRRVERRRSIARLEHACKAHPNSMSEDEALNERTEHHFCSGVYLREFSMKAGEVIMGKIHKRPCLNILLTGKIEAALSEHDENVVIEAPAIFESRAGEQKAIFVLEDARLINCLATEETDIDKMYDIFTVDSRQQYLEYQAAREDSE